MRPESTLLSDMEPIEGVVNAIRAGSERAERISQTLLTPEPQSTENENEHVIALTHSERKVLRLLGKGWGINQIATLLKKSNKTISAQKNSAMRRLSLRSNADMYARINSTQGMRELSLLSAYGEFEEWKNRFNKTYRHHRKLRDECRRATASFAMPGLSHYQLHLFSEFDSFKNALHHVNFSR